MCVVDLNVSLSNCQHRWYHLLRPCNPVTNLSNCASKLALEGWETKCDFCPYCDGWNLDSASYRLVGNDRSPSVGGLSRSPSLSVSLSSARRDSRRGSLARTDSSTSVSELPVVQAAGEKNRAQNSRIDAYFSQLPGRIATTEEILKDADEQLRISPVSSTLDAIVAKPVPATAGKNGRFLGKGWMKGKRMSRGFFR